MKNDYEIRGNEVVIFLRRKDGLNLETIISLEDLEKVKSFKGKWNASKGGNSNLYYVKSHLQGETIRLHRYLLNAPKGTHVDHINHDTLDNTRGNLRITSPAENHQNRLAKFNCSSGIRGVSFINKTNKWKATVVISGKKVFQRHFTQKEDAIEAVKKARGVYMPFSIEATMLSGYTEDDLLNEYIPYQRR